MGPIYRRVVVACATAAACLAPATVQAAGLTGISDQRIQDWSTMTRTYADMFGPRYSQARLIVTWDVALNPTSREANDTDAWIRTANAKGKEILVSFNHKMACRGCVQPALPTASEYGRAVAAFRNTWPSVRHFTAWNEPNHHVKATGPGGVQVEVNPADDPGLAADYYRVLRNQCVVPVGGATCTAIAGDFLDGDGGGTYVQQYKSVLDGWGLTPPVWAIHPYTAINRGNETAVDSFLRLVSGPVWFTEAGAQLCVGGNNYGGGAQDTAAQRLNDLMHKHRFRVDRTYYYHLGSGDGYNGSGCNWDSGLMHWDERETRPALFTLFPDLRGSFWGFRHTNTTGSQDLSMAYSGKGRPLVADWNGDGIDTPATYDNGVWAIRNSQESGHPEIVFNYGDDTMIPVAGDWNGDGVDTVGAYKPSTGMWYLRNSNSSGLWDIAIQYGNQDMLPEPGDWNGDGIDTIGVHVPYSGVWHLRNSNSPGDPDMTFEYGGAWTEAVVGDWDGNGTDTVGVFSPGPAQFFLRNANSSGDPSYPPFQNGNPGDVRLVGDWNGDGIDTTGIVR